MDNARLASTADKLLSFFMALHIKIVKIAREETALNPSSSHYRALGMLMVNAPLPVSEIGKRLCISKPNMTSLIDRLIADGMVVRLPDKSDRRVINIDITDRGRQFMEESINIVKERIKKNLEHLDDGELDKLHDSLTNAENIFYRLDERTSEPDRK